MAARTEWAGTLTIGLFTLPLEGVKATGKYTGKEPLKELCSCHHLPTDKRRRCATSGDVNATVVKGTERPDGTWAVIDEAKLEQIKQETESGEVTMLAYEPRENVAINTASDLFYLRLPRKQPGYDEQYGVLKELLGQDDRAIIGKIVRREREYAVAIYVEGDKLCMSTLRYSQELNTPEADVLLRPEVKAPNVEMLRTLLNALELPEGFDIATVQDESVTRKQAAVAQALTGKPSEVATTEVAATTAPAPDLMATLSAAVEQAEASRAKPARKASTKAKVKA